MEYVRTDNSDVIINLEKQLQAEKDKNRWRDIKEEFIKTKEKVLLLNCNQDVAVGRLIDGELYTDNRVKWFLSDITHWKPIIAEEK